MASLPCFTVLQMQHQLRPLAHRVREPFNQGALGRGTRQQAVEPLFERSEDRGGVIAPRLHDRMWDGLLWTPDQVRSSIRASSHPREDVLAAERRGPAEPPLSD